MNSSDTRVATYLDDLARMLSDIDPGERDEVLAGIREHLDAEIGSGDGGDAAVQAALLRLGPPERVAAEARAGQPAQAPFARGRPRLLESAHPTAVRAVATGVSLAGGIVVGRPCGVLVDAPIAILTLSPGGRWTLAATRRGLLPHPSEIVLLLPAAVPLWLVVRCVTVWLVPLVLVLLAPELPRPKIWVALAGAGRLRARPRRDLLATYPVAGEHHGGRRRGHGILALAVAIDPGGSGARPAPDAAPAAASKREEIVAIVVLVATLWLDPMVVSTPQLVTIGAVLGAMPSRREASGARPRPDHRGTTGVSAEVVARATSFRTRAEMQRVRGP